MSQHEFKFKSHCHYQNCINEPVTVFYRPTPNGNVMLASVWTAYEDISESVSDERWNELRDEAQDDYETNHAGQP